jgi:hypothetical protein
MMVCSTCSTLLHRGVEQWSKSQPQICSTTTPL